MVEALDVNWRVAIVLQLANCNYAGPTEVVQNRVVEISVEERKMMLSKI